MRPHRILTILGGVLLFASLDPVGPGHVVAQNLSKKEKDLRDADLEALRNDAAYKKTGIASPPRDANDLSMEVNALRTLYLFRGDPDQVEATQHPDGPRLWMIRSKSELCKQAIERAPAVVSDAYRKLLIDLRAALLLVDEARIEELDKKLAELQAKEDPDLDDQIQITEPARKITLVIVRSDFTAEQVAGYIQSYGKELPNPRSLLFATMRIEVGKVAETPKATPEEWKKIREFTMRECSWQLGGIGSAKTEDARAADVAKLLDDAYAFEDKDLKKSRVHQNLRNRARGLAISVGPTDLIKNVIEHDVAELLSNPRTSSAVTARQMYLAWKDAKDKK
jgi:hypothetical protein